MTLKGHSRSFAMAQFTSRQCCVVTMCVPRIVSQLFNNDVPLKSWIGIIQDH